MAGFLDWLAKGARAIGAQLNPWDDGEDFNSVWNAPAAPQPKPQPQQPAAPSQGAPAVENPFAPKSSPFDLSTDGFMKTGAPKIDYNNQLTQQKQAENKQNVIDDLVKGAKDFGEGLVKGTVSTGQKVFNTLDVAAEGAVGASKVAVDLLKGDQDAAQADNRAIMQRLQDIQNRQTITGDQGTFLPGEEARKSGDIVEGFIKPIAQTAGEVVPFVVPYGKIIKGAAPTAARVSAATETQLGKTGSALAGKATQYGAEGAVIAPTMATANALNQFGRTGEVNPEEALKAGFEGAIFNAAVRGVGDLATTATTRAKMAIDNQIHDNLVKASPEYAKLNDETQTLAATIKEARTNGASIADIQPQIQALRTNAETMNAMRTRIAEAGFAKVPELPRKSDTTVPMREQPDIAQSRQLQPKVRTDVPENASYLSRQNRDIPEPVRTPKSAAQAETGKQAPYSRVEANKPNLRQGELPPVPRRQEVVSKLPETGDATAPNEGRRSLLSKAQQLQSSRMPIESKAQSSQNSLSKGISQKTTTKQAKPLSDFAKDRVNRRLVRFVGEERAREIVANKPEAVKFEQLSRHIERATLPEGEQITKVGVTGSDRPKNIDVSTKASRTKQLSIRGKKAMSKEYKIPVSTRETRRKKIDVRQKREKDQEYVARQGMSADNKEFTELVPLDKKRHQLKNGVVVDKEGKPVGSYLKITDDGQKIAYLEGKPVNITNITGDIEMWGNVNKAFTDMDRLIELNAPTKEIARRVQDFTTGFKDGQEAAMKTDLFLRRKELAKREHDLYDALPKRSLKKDLTVDMFRIMEKKVGYKEMYEKYGKDFVDNHMIPTAKWARVKVFDEILDNTNKVLERNGYDAIPRRNNYITHIQQDPSFFKKVGIGIQDLNLFGKSVSSDVNPGRVRGVIPDEIVGKTAETGARKRFNKFALERKGSLAKQDFFEAIDNYLEPMLFNQYMTPAASRVRIVERAFRLQEKTKQLEFEKLVEQVGMEEARKQQVIKPKHKNLIPSKGPFVTAIQEYGNILAGKSNRVDRALMETGKAAKAVEMSTRAQGIVGASSIPGSTTSALAQVLSLPQTFARDNPMSLIKAAFDMGKPKQSFKDGIDPIRRSPFMRARYTDASSKRVSAMRKYTNAASVPMELIERATGEFSWRVAYNAAKKKNPNITELEAVRQADIATKKTLAGRGIGDRPELMNSKALGIFTQFGLEVNNMRVQFFKDFTPVQKAKFIVAAAAMNWAYQGVTGNAQLPDFLKAAYDTYEDFIDAEDDESLRDKAIQTFQRFLGETAKFVPGANSVVNAFVDDKTKEAIFGEGSEVSRFATPAASRIVSGLIDIMRNGIDGKVDDTLKSIAALIPTGTQIKRSVEGIETLNKGYTEDSKGNIQTQIDQNSLENQIKAPLFGKNSLKEVQSYYDANARSLSDKQTTAFKDLMNKGNAGEAKKYLDAILLKRETNKKDEKTDSAGSTEDQNADAIEAIKNANITDGTWKMENGLVVNKEGEVQRSYYKDLAKAHGDDKTEIAYQSYLKGYGLNATTTSSKSESKSGNALLDSLVGKEAETSRSSGRATKAIALFQKDKKYEDVPEWVKDRYYKESGFTKKDVEYAAFAEVKKDTKLDEYYRPYAKKHSHEELLQELRRGRTESIYRGHVMAQDSIITQLYKDGHLSYVEAKALKNLKLDRTGKQTEDSVTKSGKGGRGRGRGGKKGAKPKINLADLARLANKPRVPETKEAPTTSSIVATAKLRQTQLKRYSRSKKKVVK